MLRYHYQTGVEKQKSTNKLWIVVPSLMLIVGGYVLVNALAPTLTLPFDGPRDATAKKLVDARPAQNENRLYIPQVNVDVEIVDGSDAAALGSGAWHRVPENGDPKAGGNFVVSARSFSMGLTPQATRSQSPFYHIDALTKGDQIYVDYGGTRFAYEVTKKYAVPEADSSVDEKSKEPKLTLYTYDVRDPRVGRQVVEAKPIGKISWVNGVAKLQADASDSEDQSF